MANVLFSRTDSPSTKPITDGQIIFDTSGNGKMYLDNGTTRLEMGGAIDVDTTLDATSTNPIQNKGVAGVMLSELEEVRGTTKKGFLTDALATKTLDAKIGTTDISSIGDGTVTGAISDVNGKLAKYKIDKISVNKPDLAIGTNIIDGTTFTLSKGIYFITIKVQGISAITRNDQRIEFWFSNTKRRSISQASLPHNTPYPLVAFGCFMNVVDEDTVSVYSYVDTTTLSLFSVDMEIIKLLG